MVRVQGREACLAAALVMATASATLFAFPSVYPAGTTIYRETEALREIGQVIGQHHPQLIPKGLPGAGNLINHWEKSS